MARTKRVLICGSRDWADEEAIEIAIQALPALTVVIHGGARGADKMAAGIATRLGLHTAEVRPLWDHFGNAAGHVRNAAMLDLEPSLVIAFWDGKSKGTEGTIKEARRRGIPVEIVDPVPPSDGRER